MHNHCSYKLDTDLQTELLQSFKVMVLQPCAIHLANPLFMRMSWLGYLIFLIQVSPTSGSTSMKALIPIIPLTWPDLTFVLVMLLSASPMHGFENARYALQFTVSLESWQLGVDRGTIEKNTYRVTNAKRNFAAECRWRPSARPRCTAP